MNTNAVAMAATMTTTPTASQINDALPNGARKLGGGAGGALESEDVTVVVLLTDEALEFDAVSEEELKIEEVEVTVEVALVEDEIL